MQSPNSLNVSYISSTDAAERYGLTNDHIASLCRRKKVEGVLAGGRIWFLDEASLKSYLERTQREREARHRQLSEQIRKEQHAATSVSVTASRHRESAVALALAVFIVGSLYAAAAPVHEALSQIPWRYMPAAVASVSTELYERTFITAATKYLDAVDVLGEVQASSYAELGGGVSSAAASVLGANSSVTLTALPASIADTSVSGWAEMSAWYAQGIMASIAFAGDASEYFYGATAQTALVVGEGLGHAGEVLFTNAAVASLVAAYAGADASEYFYESFGRTALAVAQGLADSGALILERAAYAFVGGVYAVGDAQVYTYAAIVDTMNESATTMGAAVAEAVRSVDASAAAVAQWYKDSSETVAQRTVTQSGPTQTAAVYDSWTGWLASTFFKSPVVEPEALGRGVATKSPIAPLRTDVVSASSSVTAALPTVTQLVVREVAPAGVSKADLDAAIGLASNQLRALIYENSGKGVSVPQYIAAGGSAINPSAPANRIDRLDGVTLTNVSLDGYMRDETVGVGSGGTGTSSAPLYGQVLLGNAWGGYDLVGTSSLGITGGGGGGSVDTSAANTWTALQQFGAGASSTLFSANRAWFGDTGTSTFTSAGWLGIGTTSPSRALSVEGGGLFSGDVSLQNLAAAAATLSGAFTAGSATIIGATELQGSLTIAGTTTLSKGLVLGGNQLTGLREPVTGSDAATKDYVDSFASGLVWQAPVIGVGSTTPPVSPNSGDRYVVGSGATGAWSGQANKITEYNGSSWSFTAPSQGYTVFSTNYGVQYNYNGSAWVQMGSGLSLSATTGTLEVSRGGTGLLNGPTYGQLLVGNASGGYTLTATSSLGISTSNITEGSKLFFTDARVGSYITGSTTLPAFLNYWQRSGSNLSYSAGNIAIGTSSPYSKLTVWGGSTGRILEAITNASTTALWVSATGFGTTTLSGLNISGFATSTSNVGFNLTSGCFAVNGNCITGGGGSGNVGSGTAGQVPYYAAAGATLSSTSTLFIASNGRVGVGSTTPSAKFSIHAQYGDTNEFLLSIASSTLSGTTTLFSIAPSGTTTVANGVNITGGCFSVNGVCITTSISGGLAGSTAGAIVVARKTDAYTIGTATTTLIFNSETVDRENIHSAVTGTTTIASAGDYEIYAAMQISSPNISNPSTCLSVLKNGAVQDYRCIGDANDTGGGSTVPSVQVTSVLTLQVGDQIAVGAVRYGSGTTSFLPAANSNVLIIKRIGTVPFNQLTNAVGTSTVENSFFGQLWNWNSLGTTTALSLSPNVLTSGKGLSVTTASTGLTGDLVYIAATSSGAGITGNLLKASNAAGVALAVSASGFGTTTLSGLAVSGSATSTSNVGFNLTSGCFAVNGNCITGGGAGSIDGLSDGKSDGGSTFLGAYAGENDDGSNTNTGVGNGALYTNTSGQNNAAFGVSSLYYNDTGSYNVAMGLQALFNNISGDNNVGVGYYALGANQTGGENVGVGMSALGSSQSGTSNTALGGLALENQNGGSYNVALGSRAGRGATGTNSSQNVFVGYGAGISNSTGSGNTFLGFYSGSGMSSGNYNILIGNGVDAPNLSGSAQLNIGNLLYGTGVYGDGYSTSSTPTAGKIAIGTTTPSARLSVWGLGTGTDALFELVSSASTTLARFLDNGTAYFSGNVGIGTTTPNWKLQVASTRPFFALSDTSAGSNLKHWAFSSQGGNLYMATSSDGYATSTIPAFMIRSNGNVGIGTTTPYAKLSVEGAIAGASINADSSSATSTFAGGLNVGSGALVYDYSGGLTTIQNLAVGSMSFDTDAGIVSWFDMPVTSNASAGTVESYTAYIDGYNVLTIYGESDGSGGATNFRVGIGTTSPLYVLDVASTTGAGSVARFTNATGNCTINPTTTSLACSSDERLKKDVEEIGAVQALAGVMALRPVKYNWLSELSSTSLHAGFIAQEVNEIFPDLVAQGDNGYYTLNYGGFAPYLVSAIQQLGAVVMGYAQEFTTKKLCVEDVCVTRDQFLRMVEAAGESASAPASEESPDPGSTPDPEMETGAGSAPAE